jgi:hypothetical protein
MRTNMEPAPTIKDPSINDPIYNQQIVIGYTEDQKGQNIQDEDVVRPNNHIWARNGLSKTHEWKKKSSGRCPTYGTCSLCWKAGPVGKKYTCTHQNYLILFYGLNTLDSITVADIIGQDLEVTRADCMQNWVRTPMMQYNELCCDLAITRQLNKDKSLDADAKKAMRMKRLSAIWDLKNDSIVNSHPTGVCWQNLENAILFPDGDTQDNSTIIFNTGCRWHDSKITYD